MNNDEDRLELGELNGFLWAKHAVATMVRDGLLTDAQAVEFSRRLRDQRESSKQQRTAAPALSIVKVVR